MGPEALSRRAFLAAAGAAGAVWLAVEPEVLSATLARARALAAQGAPGFKSLTPAEAADLEAVAMRIFPSDGTPGAKEAGVIRFLDEALTGFAAGQKEPLLAGLGDLNKAATARRADAKSFAALGPADQDALLKEMEQTPFFNIMRFASCIGMFGNPSYGGNRDMVGWKLIGHEAHGVWQPPFGWYDAEVAKGG